MDRRKVLGIPAEYMGNLVHVTTWLTFQELIDPPLGEIARQHPFPSLLYFFPQNPQGNFDSLTCLTDSDMEAMSWDPEWTSMVEYIG